MPEVQTILAIMQFFWSGNSRMRLFKEICQYHGVEHTMSSCKTTYDINNSQK